MAHNVERMMFAGKTPWHGLGKQITEDDMFSIERCIDHAGLNWGVRRYQLCVQNGPAKGAAVDSYAVVRSSDSSVLGVVGNKWRPLQNLDAFKWFKPFLDTQMCALHTAGSLEAGAKIWVLAQILDAPMQIAKNDEVGKFILLSNSHDGSTSVRCGFTPQRVVCANTLAMAHSSNASKLIRIRHGRDVKENLEKVREVMNAANSEFEATAAQFRRLASRFINQRDLLKYVHLMVEIDTDEEVSSRKQNITAEIIQRFERDKARGSSWWTAYNAVNEWLNHSRGHNLGTRLNSLWYGKSAKDNSKALKLALEMAV
jgi:phage/plasmid-like protein (TIGR03299 family)